MTNVVIFAVALVAYFIIRTMMKRSTVRCYIAFAGSPTSNSVNTKEVPMPKNNPIYKEGDIEINVSGLKQYIIEGNSLSPLGITDGAIVFVEEFSDLSNFDLKVLIGRFIILRIDNERILHEHPLKNVPINNGFKARKSVKIISNDGEKETIKKDISDFLNKDNDGDKKEETDKEEFIKRILDKFEFASQYYKNDKELIMSITYKKGGTCKDYSFHSPKFLRGLVKYTSCK